MWFFCVLTHWPHTVLLEGPHSNGWGQKKTSPPHPCVSQHRHSTAENVNINLYSREFCCLLNPNLTQIWQTELKKLRFKDLLDRLCDLLWPWYYLTYISLPSPWEYCSFPSPLSPFWILCPILCFTLGVKPVLVSRLWPTAPRVNLSPRSLGAALLTCGNLDLKLIWIEWMK